MPAALADILAAEYLGALEQRPLPDLRTMRAECQEIETGLSLLRRIVQGHLDIVGSELRRRADGESGDLADLVDRLPDLLADRTSAPGIGRLSQLMAPEALDPALEAELEALVGEGSAVELTSRDEVALRALVDGLTLLETEVSNHRRALFERIDALQAELVRRYRTGEASVDSLLT